MPIQPYSPPPFELEVSDLVRGKTHVKQKVRFLKLEHDDAARTATVHIQVVPYELAQGGGYGVALLRPPFAPYSSTIVADNNRLVDVRNGNILTERYPLSGPLTDAQWAAEVARVQASPVPAMYQGDYFLYLRDNQPLVIGQVIRQYIQQADAPPSRFA